MRGAEGSIVITIILCTIVASSLNEQ